ncbi:MAG: DDE-type integrase/transposase/recombinase [Rhodobacteraceae bacterium]|nr:DDE-type integrase/transposase/recombinase [Paracoccaceae bacterium]
MARRATARLFGLRWHALTRQNAFGTLCSTLGIEYRLTPPRPPQTNGMVERFNGRLEDVSMFDLAKGWGCTAKSGFITARLHNQL